MAEQQASVERYAVVLSMAGVPPDYAGMDGLILIVARTEREFARRERDKVADDPGELWNKSTQRKILARSSESETSPNPDYEFVGHDVGHLNMSGSAYSLIIHYLLHNRPGGGADFILNEHRLLPTRNDATRLLAEWNAWTPADEGDKEVFDYADVIQPYAVFRANHWRGLDWQ